MATPVPRIVSPTFLPLWAASFAFYLSFYLLLPALPLYARTLGIPEDRIGLIIGCFAVSWSHTVGPLLGIRLLHGAGMGLYPAAAVAVVADLSPSARRGEAVGLWGAAGSVALAVGPLCAVWIVDRGGFAALFRLSTGIALTALVLTAGQRETLVGVVSPSFTVRSLLSRAVLFPSSVIFCFMTTYGALVAFLAIYAESRGANPGIFFLVMAVVIALARGYAGIVSDRVGRPPVAAAGQAVAAAALVVLAASDGIVAFAGAGALYGLGLGATQPALVAWAVDLAGPEDRGRAMGTFYAAFELGIAAGAVCFGAVLARTSYPIMFLAAATMAMLAAALAASRWRRRPHSLRGDNQP